MRLYDSGITAVAPISTGLETDIGKMKTNIDIKINLSDDTKGEEYKYKIMFIFNSTSLKNNLHTQLSSNERMCQRLPWCDSPCGIESKTFV